MEIFRPVQSSIEDYQLRLIDGNRPQAVMELETYAQKNGFPIVGPLVGSFLRTLAKMIDAQTVFELGSGFGYSAYWFLSGMSSKGEIHCTDSDPENQALAEKSLRTCGLWEQVHFHIGRAEELFPSFSGPFDIIYNDVDKQGYPHCFELAKARLRSGGLYICDNVLWSGRVTMPEDEIPSKKPSTLAIRKHNQMVFNDPDFTAFINPTRDGVLVARKH